jgi:hypothetical protein
MEKISLNLFGGSGNNLKGPGPLGQNAASSPEFLFNNIISSIIGVMTSIAFIWFAIKFISSAVSYIGAGGDKIKVQNAQDNLKSAVVGLVIVIASIFIIDVISLLLGVNILNPLEWVGTF